MIKMILKKKFYYIKIYFPFFLHIKYLVQLYLFFFIIFFFLLQKLAVNNELLRELIWLIWNW
jgi:hypothetical protein